MPNPVQHRGAIITRLHTYYFDEIAWIGLVAGMLLAVLSVTWFTVDLGLGFRGLFFSILLMAGMALHPKFSVTVYDRAISRRHFGNYVFGVIVGIMVTGILNWFIINPFILSVTPMDPLTQLFYLMMAAISETFFLFWFLYPTIETFIHPIAAVFFIPVAAGLLHLFVYGANPVFLLAVTGDFLVQAVIMYATRRLSVPLTIHLVVNVV